MNGYFKYSQAIKCKDTQEVCFGYVNYLKSKHWLQIRDTLINRNSVCSVCGEKHNLQLHHVTYAHLGYELLDTDLMIVCSTCHKLLHHKNKPIKKRKKSKSKKIIKNCKNCKYCGTIKVKYSSKFIFEPYCKYKGLLNPTAVCEKFRIK